MKFDQSPWERGLDAKYQKSEEEALRRYTDLILGASGDGIYGINTDGRTIFVNPAALEMTGFTKEEVLGSSQHELSHHSHADGSHYSHLDCPVYKAFRDGKVHHVTDEVFWRKDGSCFPVEYVSTPIWDEGKLVGAVVSFRDITRRKEYESALRDSEQRARALQSELHHVSRLGAMGEMASNIAHELNQPLAATINYVQAASKLVESRENIDRSKVTEILEKAVRQSNRAADIIRGLRSFVSKGDSTRQWVDVNDITSEAIDLSLFGDAPARDAIRYEGLGRSVSIHVDKIRFQQVIVNLVRNGLDAIKVIDNGQILVRAQKVGQKLEICVMDNGPGIAAEIEDSLFRPFVTTKPEGMGVGLSICKSIIEEHCGNLSVHKNPEGGATFLIMLPLDKTPDPLGEV